jgi:hypothetical protein
MQLTCSLTKLKKHHFGTKTPAFAGQTLFKIQIAPFQAPNPTNQDKVLPEKMRPRFLHTFF